MKANGVRHEHPQVLAKVSYTVRMHHLPSLFSILFSAVPNRFKYRHNACFRYVAFIYFFAVPNRLKYHQNACFRDIVSFFL